MTNLISNLIIPRINLNSHQSIDEAIQLVEEHSFDSFILFASDKVAFGQSTKFQLENLSELRKKLDLISKDKVLFFLDGENGLGRRCSVGEEHDFSNIETLQEQEIKRIFDSINEELYLNKISFNLAPVVDLRHKMSKVLHGRTFSESPRVITRIAKIFTDSCESNNLISCLKHFPGHGIVGGDTHDELITSSSADDNLIETHLYPFKCLVKDVDMVMVNHIYYKYFDSSPVPASMSENIMRKLLLEELGFKGLIISDSIRMGAITNNFSESELSRQFILNGGDLILDPLNPIQLIDVVGDVYSTSSDYIDEKIKKIIKIKNKARSLMSK
jgi:beta-N-acetylhexosaminidase